MRRSACPPSVVWTENFADILNSRADIVVELTGGLDPTESWLRKCFAAGKSVVTANKQLIAYRGAALARLAAKHDVQLVHGAAVAGGVPVIRGHAARPFGRPDYAHQRHRERDVQLHPEPHGDGRELRGGAGRRAGAGLRGGGSLGGCGRLRRARQAVHPVARRDARGA